MSRFRALWLLAAALLVARSSFAFPKTNAGSITASAISANGEISIRGDRWSSSLLVAVKIDNTIYTNNPVPSGVVRLDSAIFGQLRDTLAVRWMTADTVDINLRIYPSSNNLIAELSFNNHSRSVHSCSAQVLQNYGVGSATAPYLATDRDYSNIARQIPANGVGAAPSVIFLAEHDIGVDPYEPGIATVERFSGTGLQLRGPQHLYFGVWTALAQPAFGPPATLPVGCDGGLLLTWNAINVGAATAPMIARWALSSELNACSSSDVVLCSTTTPCEPLDARTFNLEAIAYSVNQRGITRPRVILNVDPALTILAPHDGTATSDTALLNGDLQRGMAETADWKILNLGNAGSPYDAHLQMKGDNLTPFYRGGCNFSVMAPDGTTPIDVADPYIVHDSVLDHSLPKPCSARHYLIDGRDDGSGIDRAVITGSNFVLSANNYIPGTDSVRYRLSVIDTTQDGSATISIFDRLQHSVTRSYTYCSVGDTAAPIVWIESHNDSAFIVLLDNRPWDRGLNLFTVSTLVNAAIDSSTLYSAIDSESFWVRRIDPKSAAAICLRATDRAGNTSSVHCWSATLGVIATSTDRADLRISPNPARTMFDIRCSETIVAVDVLDLLGRVVLSQTAPSAQLPIDVSGLTNGAYVVRVVLKGDQVLSRRIQIIR